jgi:ketosteroid isomerase-like protein
MIEQPRAEAFARTWIEAWNTRDLERILPLYAEDVELVSPIAARLLGDPGGVVRGQAALRAYFEKGFEHNPNLQLQLERVYAGASSVVVCYRGTGSLSAETLELDAAGKIRRALAHLARPAQPAGGPARGAPPAGPRPGPASPPTLGPPRGPNAGRRVS